MDCCELCSIFFALKMKKKKHIKIAKLIYNNNFSLTNLYAADKKKFIAQMGKWHDKLFTKCKNGNKKNTNVLQKPAHYWKPFIGASFY